MEKLNQPIIESEDISSQFRDVIRKGKGVRLDIETIFEEMTLEHRFSLLAAVKSPEEWQGLVPEKYFINNPFRDLEEMGKGTLRSITFRLINFDVNRRLNEPSTET